MHMEVWEALVLAGKEKKGGSTGTVREAIPEDKYKSNDDSAVLPWV